MKKTNKKILIIIILFFSVFFLVSRSNRGISHLKIKSYNHFPFGSNIEYNNETLIYSRKFQLHETTEDIASKNKVDSINITLPSSTWNITDLELNFTSIKLGREVKTIEDGDKVKFEELSKRTELGWGIQLNITEPTTIFGVYLYGFWAGNSPNDEILVQIQGYNSSLNIPNGTIYNSKTLNFSQIPSWNLQEFESEIQLNEGYYCLVLNGSNLENEGIEVYWRYNDQPQYKDLYRSKYDGGKWVEDGVEKVFLHKLIQRINRSYNPEEINMTVEFGGTDYNVTNGLEPYTGTLTIPNKNFSPNNEYLSLPIKNNKSIELLLNVSYYIRIQNFLFSEGNIIIKADSNNTWTLLPDINRYFYNYSVKFEYPKSWDKISILRDNGTGWANITDQIQFTNDYIIISNNTITPGAIWNITANSPNIDFTLNAPESEFGPGQDLEFSVFSPNSQGNLTFILINSLGFEEYQVIIENDPGEEVAFNYLIPTNPHGGIWKAFIFWNNETDGGFQSQSFKISSSAIPPILIGNDEEITGFIVTPQLIFIILLSAIITVSTSLTSYQIIKRYRRKIAEQRQKVFNKFMDALNLDYIIIVEKNSGINFYEQLLTTQPIDATLIAGFLQGIRSFGIELTGSEEQSHAIKLEYKNLKILMSEYKEFRIINIMKDNPSKDFHESIKTLSYDIDKSYGEYLKDFDGAINQFKGIKNLIEKHLHTSLNYPLKVAISEDIKIDSNEEELVKKALEIIKERNQDYFLASFLISSNKELNIRNIEAIFNLINKKVFIPKN